MDRRSVLLSVAALVLANRRRASAAEFTQEVEMDSWVVSIPEDWLRSTDPRPALYYDAPDGTRGCYMKVLQAPRAMDARSMAEQLQSIYERAFRSQGKGWEVRLRTGIQAAAGFRSTMNLYDESNSYRISSYVFARRTEAFQVTAHDYSCLNYDQPLPEFDAIRDSMRWRGGPA